MSKENKILNDEELKQVTGGTNSENVSLRRWYVSPAFPDHILLVKQEALNAKNESDNLTGAIFVKYWYDGTNAWNHGYCTAPNTSVDFYIANAPANIYDDKMYVEKPFK